MQDKRQILSLLKDEFNRWEELLAGMSDEEIVAGQLASQWSIKDVIAHLMAWQQRSIARVEAASLDREPEFPRWPVKLNPEAEDVEQINAWIYETNRARPWASVYQDWRDGFLRFMELAEAIPEKDLLEVGRYRWMQEYPLSLFLLSSYEHHDEHIEELLAWLRQHEDMKITGESYG